MNYKYYQLINNISNCIYRMPDGAFIPLDIENGDYRNYLSWVNQGNTAPVIINPDDVQNNHEE
jgi:hypothetical protein